MTRLVKITAFISALFLFVSMTDARAQGLPSAPSLESHVKSGLVYNFLKYTKWPMENTSTQGNLHVCLLGGDPFEGALLPLNGRTAQQRKIRIHSFQPSEIPGNFCHVVVVNSKYAANIEPLMEILQTPHILTISDIENFAGHGGMVEMALNQENKVEIHINKKAVQRSYIQIEDRLLKLAEVVE